MIQPYLDRLDFNPKVSSTEPVIRGTFLTAGFVARLVSAGEAKDEFSTHYPNVTDEDVRAALQWVIDKWDGEVTLDDVKVAPYVFIGGGE